MIFIPTYFQPRSGSKLIDALLNQHPNIISSGEVFSIQRRVLDLQLDLNMSNFLANEKNCNTIRNIKNREKKYLFFQYAHVDIKIFSKDLNINYFARYLSNNFKNFLFIKRDNLLKRVISFQKSFPTKKWHYYKNETIPNKKIIIPVYEPVSLFYEQYAKIQYIDNYKNLSLIDQLKFMHAFDQKIENILSSNLDLLKITYENDIEKNPLVGVNKITDWMNITKFNDYKIPIQKAGRSLEEELENYEEVYNHLKNTEFEWMLK